MKVVVQRAKDAFCKVEGKTVGKIDFGLMILVGFTEGDTLDKLEYMAKKIANLRIFEDDNEVLNRSILDVTGSILSISQFTLYASCEKGNRPSYIKAMKSEEAKVLYQKFNQILRTYCPVEEGVFGADMQISFTNQGPVTILLER